MPAMFKPYHYHELTLDLFALKRQYSDLFDVWSIGETEDNRLIYMCSIGNKEAEKTLLFNASIHGREYMNTNILMKKMAYILSHWEEHLPETLVADLTYEQLFKNVCLYFIPVVNPDGVAISQIGKAGVRSRHLKMFVKEPHELWKSNACGVDLNRNFSVGWENASEDVSNHTANFRGVHPASERETRVMMHAINELKHLTAVITYHLSGEVIYGKYPDTPKEIQDVQQRLTYIAQNITGYAVVNEEDNEPMGGLGEWCIQRRKVPHITIETGIGDAPLSDQEFPVIWQQNQFVFEAVALGLCIC